jgi:hypothetical protein
MKRDFLVRSVEYFSERDYRDIQEALGQPGAAGVRPREGTGSSMAFAASKLSQAIREKEVG